MARKLKTTDRPNDAAHVSGRRTSGKGPQFVRYFGPLLDALRNLGGSGTPTEVVSQIATDLRIPDEIQNELLPSGYPRFQNQIEWARFYLAREGLLDSSVRGIWSFTERGRATHLSSDDARNLFSKWAKIDQQQRRPLVATTEPAAEPTLDDIADAGAAPPINYREQVREILRLLPPSGFERLSQRILREAGFTQVVVTGQSGDGGIDGYGTLQINLLLSFKVLFQCKRYSKSVSSPHVRDFRGAMAGRADKGIFITTDSFTAEAIREATRDGVPPIELIDGEKLIDLLERLELGLRPVKTFEVVPSFFGEFQEA